VYFHNIKFGEYGFQTYQFPYNILRMYFALFQWCIYDCYSMDSIQLNNILILVLHMNTICIHK